MRLKEHPREHRARSASTHPLPLPCWEGRLEAPMIDLRTRQQAIALYDRFTHEGMERRAFMAEMVRLAGSVAAAELLIAGIAASPAAAAIVPESDPHIFTRSQILTGGYKAYVAEPRTR